MTFNPIFIEKKTIYLYIHIERYIAKFISKIESEILI